MPKRLRNKVHTKNCHECAKPFKYEMPLYCSIPCGNRAKARKNTFWEFATEQEKLKRLEEMFLKNVVKSEDKDVCWGWNGYVSNHGGYAVLNKQGSTMRAHRLSYMLYKGNLKNHMNVNHTCHNTSCTNPDHLYAGNQKQNALDRELSGRANRKNQKLTIDKVVQLKNLLKQNVDHNEIIKQFNISLKYLREIIQGKIWGWV